MASAWDWSSSRRALFCLIFVFIAAHKGLKIRANEPGELRVWVEVVLSCASVGVAIAQMFNVVQVFKVRKTTQFRICLGMFNSVCFIFSDF